MKRFMIIPLLIFALFSCGKNEISNEEFDGYTLIRQTKGPVLGYTTASILEADGTPSRT